MGILKRVVSMTKAAANEMLDKMENPVMMLNHYLRDLDEEIAKTENALARQQAEERVLQAKLNELHKQASYYEEKAVQAATQDREAEARMALEAKLLYTEQAEETARLHQHAAQAVIEIKLGVDALKEEKVRLQGKRTELAARVRQTSGASGFGSAYSLQGSSASKGFERIEQRVMEWEAERELAKTRYSAGAYQTTAYSNDAYVAASAQPGNDQRQEQLNARVDEELQRLMGKSSGN